MLILIMQLNYSEIIHSNVDDNLLFTLPIKKRFLSIKNK